MRASNVLCLTITAALFVPATTAGAIVRTITAEIRGSVQAFVNGESESSDEAIENVGDTGVQPPVDVRASLENLDDAQAVAIAEFRDPTQTGPQRNPGEISIEADCFSSNADTSYELTSSAVERRVVSFSSEELDDTGTVRSAVFASGAIFVWSLEDGQDLTGLSGEVSFVVRRFDVDADGAPVGEATVLVEETVSLVGGPNGSVTRQNSNGLFVFAGDLAILPDDDASVDVEGLPDINLESLAVAQVAIILEQDVNYSYDTVAGEDFMLEAEFTTNVSNVPGGTGVVAVFGRPFDEASDIIALGIPEDSATSAGQPSGLESLVGNLCGLLGLETLPFLALSLTMFHTRRYRIRRTR